MNSVANRPTYWLTTLGCAKNQVDSEKIEAMLAEAGYAVASAPSMADVVMVNTCAFIEEARRESVETILELQDERRDGARTIVLGCMAQRFGTEVEKALPEVDAVVGLDRYDSLVPLLDRFTYGPDWQPVRLVRPAMDILHLVNRPAPTMPYAYVKVAEGCDKPCTFCAIPLIRGKQRSRRPPNIVEEVEGLVAAGVSEIVLVAQDLAAYGRDIDAPGDIVDLLGLVTAVEGVERVRLLYLYPKEVRPRLVAEMCQNPKIASYFDLSLQHAAQPLLRAMKRPGNGERFLQLIDQIREADADAALRSSFIVGFPGESAEQVEELAEFLEAASIDWAGFFPYSPEEGTPAAMLDGRVDPDEVSERLRYLSSIQENLTAEANLASVGSRVRVLIDQLEDGSAVGRSYREAPEIDGVIVLDRGSVGEWVDAEITSAYGTDREAVVVG
ncbi:MAG: 30S ribosomal protein S12 methylthiotransferase RimO [Actinomycetota bacterium]|nr:30S ribosomal protein S12 methylthiotransferase RimO [Actinomycetota bacterium]